jgi:cell division protein ZapA
MCSDKNVLKVRIYGAEYPVRGYADANYIKQVADYVDKKMREVDKTIRVDSSLRVAILASLNITDELFKEQKQNALLRQQLEDKIDKLNALIDRQLQAPPDKPEKKE